MDSQLNQLRIEKAHRASRKKGSRWPLVLVVLFLLLGSATAWMYAGRSPAIVVKTVRVKPVAVSEGASDLVTLTATGYVTAAHKIELASKVVGKVAWVGVEMGDKIKKDQVLVRLEDEEYKARVSEQQGVLDNARAKLAELQAGSRLQEIAESQALLDQAESELLNAEVSRDRMKSLEATRSVSRQQMDDAEALVRSRRALVNSQKQQLELFKAGPRKEQIDAQLATVRQLEGSLELVMVQLRDTIIRAPFAATVLDRNVEVGEFVTTGFVGDKGAKGYVLSIADLNDLRVELDISQDHIARAGVGQPCWIVTDAYPDHKYAGSVELISPEANRQKATVLVRVKVLDPDDMLKPEMNATVSFLSAGSAAPGAGSAAATTQPSSAPAPSAASAESPSVIRIPGSAIRSGSVFIVDNGRAVKRQIEVGLTTSRGDVDVRRGLIGGEDLIASPPEGLKEGDKVSVDTNG